MAFFHLQEGEQIVWEAKPLTGFRTMLFFQNLIGLSIVFFLIGLVLFAPFIMAVAGYIAGPAGVLLGLGLTLLAILVFAGVISFAIANLVYNKEYYWVTNYRVIKKMGLIGYHVSSIPLERVSDVIVSRSFLEKLFGISSLHIQTLAGQYSVRGGSRFGAEGKFSAVADPEGLQKTIFELIKKHRKAEHLAI